MSPCYCTVITCIDDVISDVLILKNDVITDLIQAIRYYTEPSEKFDGPSEKSDGPYGMVHWSLQNHQKNLLLGV